MHKHTQAAQIQLFISNCLHYNTTQCVIVHYMFSGCSPSVCTLILSVSK